MTRRTSPFYFLLIFLTTTLDLLAQEEGTVMKSYVPKSKAYDIYYPAEFTVAEEENILTITSPNSGLNITVSSYNMEKKLNDEKLIEQIDEFINKYFDKEIASNDWKAYDSPFDNLVELKLEHKNTNWIWWGITNKKHLVMMSANKEGSITEEEIGLMWFMIEHLIIN